MTHDSNVRQGEGSIDEVIRSESSLSAAFLKRVQISRDLEDRFAVDVFDIWNHQSLRGVHGNANVVVGLVDDAFVGLIERTVDDRELFESVGSSLDEERHVG